jgi:hypothetical protein
MSRTECESPSRPVATLLGSPFSSSLSLLLSTLFGSYTLTGNGKKRFIRLSVVLRFTRSVTTDELQPLDQHGRTEQHNQARLSRPEDSVVQLVREWP